MTLTDLVDRIPRPRPRRIAVVVPLVLLASYCAAFVACRRSASVTGFVPNAAGDDILFSSHRWHWFVGSPPTARTLHLMFTPLHRWCLGGISPVEFERLTDEEERSARWHVYSADPVM